MIGLKLSPVLIELEDALLEHEVNTPIPPRFTDEAFRASLKIFMSVLMERMWNLQSAEDMPVHVRVDMAQKAGEELSALVKKYTDIDTTKLYQ